MKLYEVLAGQKVSIDAISKIVYRLTLAKLNVNPATKVEIGHLMRETDEVWSDEIHTVHRVIEKVTKDGKVEPWEFEDVEEAVQIAVADIAENVINYFGNAWNFPPGYKPPQSKMNLYDLHSKGSKLHGAKEFDKSSLGMRYLGDPDEKEIRAELEKILPGFGEGYKGARKTAQVERKKKFDDYKKSLHVKFKDEEKLKKLVDLIIENEDDAWKGLEQAVNLDFKEFAKKMDGTVRTEAELLDHVASYSMPKEMYKDYAVKTEKGWRSKPAKELRTLFKEKTKQKFMRELILMILDDAKIESKMGQELHDDLLGIHKTGGAPLKKLEQMYLMRKA